MHKSTLFISAFLAATCASAAVDPWAVAGQQALNIRLQQHPSTQTAKNIIVFLGDGMSIATINAARIYAGQLDGKTGEENRLNFENFPYTGLVKTYNTDAMVPDSAGTMSAIMTGVKTKSGVLSLDDGAQFGQCDGVNAHKVPTLLELAARAGKATGVVTTTRITHATPAATYSHSADREWESDSDLNESAIAHGCKDIAAQFVDFSMGKGIDVALGGGRAKFLPNTAFDPEYANKPGERKDGRDLIAQWQQKNSGGQFVWNKTQFSAIDVNKTSRLLGLFEPSHMQYESQRTNEPSLSEMTEKALGILTRNKNGFFLMVEGGRIDHAHHAGNARNALNETLEFSRAIGVALAKTNSRETLIVVTADHGHTMSLAGADVRRGNPILGLTQSTDFVAIAAPSDAKTATASITDNQIGDIASGNTDAIAAKADTQTGSAEHAHADKTPAPPLDPNAPKQHAIPTDLNGKPYTVLNYVNGPGFGKVGQPATIDEHRVDLTNVDTEDWEFRQESRIPLSSESHSGEDVAVYASGPWAQLFTGSIEQNALFHFMVYAAKLK